MSQDINTIKSELTAEKENRKVLRKASDSAWFHYNKARWAEWEAQARVLQLQKSLDAANDPNLAH